LEGKIMRNRVLKTVIVTSLVMLGLPSLATAASPTQFGEGSIKVAYGDLNIDTLAGARTLYARLEKAAKKGCDLRPYSELGSMSHYRKSRVCYDEKLTAAVERIDSDELTKIHNGK
jgi:UrcA family protein